MKKKIAKILIFVLFCSLFSSYVFAQEQEQEQKQGQEVTVSGSGFILAGDKAKARDDAISDAMRRALEQVMGTIVSSETIVENYQTVEDNIFSQTKGYIQTYQVIQERERDATTFEVTIKAIVKMADLENDLEGIGLLMRQKGKPRMMVLINEQNVGMGNADFTIDLTVSESTIMDEFKAKGFEFIDQETAKMNMQQEQAKAVARGDAQAAAALGNSYGAEVIIIGTAFAKVATGIDRSLLGGMYSVQGNISARAVRADNGQIIANGNSHGKGLHIDEVTGGTQALKKASVKLSEDLMSDILERWKKEVAGATTVKLSVTAIQSFSQLTKFKNYLKFYIRGIEEINQRSFNGGTAELEIQIKGSAEKLATELDGKDIEGFKIQVIGLTQNNVTIKLL